MSSASVSSGSAAATPIGDPATTTAASGPDRLSTSVPPNKVEVTSNGFEGRDLYSGYKEGTPDAGWLALPEEVRVR